VVPHGWDERYEALRAAWLSGRPLPDSVLVVRQGLTAWMRVQPAEVLPSQVPAAAPAVVPLPSSARQELLFALVHRSQEVEHER
jgi:hypothetical protein